MYDVSKSYCHGRSLTNHPMQNAGDAGEYLSTQLCRGVCREHIYTI